MLSFDNDANDKNLLLVDLGFKVGFKNKYRFLVISLSKDNKVEILKDKMITNYEYSLKPLGNLKGPCSAIKN